MAAKKKTTPTAPPMNHNYEIDKWFAFVGSGPKKDKPKVVDNSPIKGSKFQVQDIIARLRETAHQVKNRHPRSTGKLFTTGGTNTGTAEREGVGTRPAQIGTNTNWWYPGGPPPGYPGYPGDDWWKFTTVVMEEGNLWDGTPGPWTDPGYPNFNEPSDDDDDEE
jgi:hypothetical protein